MKFISENPILFIVLTTIITMALMLVIDNYIYKKREEQENKAKQEEEVKPVKEVKQTPITPYETLMEILDGVINKELYFWLQLTVNMKDVKIIDFAESLELVSRRIHDSISDDYIRDLCYYHDRQWIMEYVVRSVKIYLTNYIRSNPVT